MLQADDVDVRVLAGVVSLRGKVSSDEGKWNAEDAVRGMQCRVSKACSTNRGW